MSIDTSAGMSELKNKHRAMWALGDYESVAETVIPTLGQSLVDAAGVRAGERVLDVGAGTGNASLPAARTGAEVVASDLTPELLEVGRLRAEAQHLDLVWMVADAEDLPCADGQFDVALSCVGVMFAPHHHDAARELLRVVRPGGRIALASWTPGGFIGQLLSTLGPYAPPPPPGALPPPLWGDAAHLGELFGDGVEEVSAHAVPLVVDCFASAEAFLDFFKTRYGPTIAVYRSLAGTPERARELDAAVLDLAHRHDLGGGAMQWELLLWVARRAG